MALPNFDPRNGGACGKCMANKLISYIFGWLYLVWLSLGFLTLVFKPSTLNSVVKNADTKIMVLTGVFMLVYIAFTAVLLIGLHKNRRLYVKTFLIFQGIYLLTLIISFFFNLLMQPQNFGVSGFFAVLFSMFLALFILFVVRSHYLITYCNGPHPVADF